MFPSVLFLSNILVTNYLELKSLDSTVLQILEATVVSSPGQRSFYGFTGINSSQREQYYYYSRWRTLHCLDQK